MPKELKKAYFVKDGKMNIVNPTHLVNFLKLFDGKYLDLVEHKDKASKKQYGAYWSIAVPMIAEAIGEDDLKEAHRFICEHVHYEIVTMKTKDGIKNRKKVLSTSSDVMTTETYAKHYEKTQRLGAWLGINIPDPEPLHGKESNNPRNK